MPDPHPRYVCRHYPRESQTPAVSHVWDSWYCYATVARIVGTTKTYVRGSGFLRVSAQERADYIAARLNAEHDAWLADG